MALSNPVDELFAALIERLEEDPGFDVQAFLGTHPDHAPALKTRLERLRRVGLVGDARGESTLVAAMRERFGVQSEVRLPHPDRGALSALPVEELLPSRVVGGRYRILAEIGRGGMGRVFRALDLDLGRDVALKVADLAKLLPAAAPDQRQTWIERFLIEAQVTAQLEHPSIVPVHDIGIDRAGELYYTMKLVEGETLEAKIQQWHAALATGAPFPTPELLRIVIQVCQAVAFAHERGVMHRDLKPSNVMVGRFGEVQVMDWGLAKWLEASEELALGAATPSTGPLPSQTRAGEVLGTPTHMAPEQKLGDPKAIGRSTDIFGIGAILFHGLHGMPPNHANAVDAPRMREVAPELEAICRRALHPEPEQRYESTRTLGEDLRAFQDQRVVRAYATGAIAELRKWMLRNRSAAAAMAAAALALSFGLVAVLFRLQSLERGLDVLRLSANRELAGLIADADELWPLVPEKLEAFASWIDRAEALVTDLPTHRADLERRSLDDSRESRRWVKQLQSLVLGLEALQSGLMAPDAVVPGHGWSVPKRKAFVERLVTGFAPGGGFAKAWDEALPAIHTAYPSFPLSPQFGFVPIGSDPASGLWEFCHLMTGRLPLRNAFGQLLLDEESALVFVLLHPRTFAMGAQSKNPSEPNYDPDSFLDEGPPHLVSLRPYFMSKYEMTQGQYLRVTGENPSYYDSERSALESSLNERRKPLLHPVEYVNWDEASRVCTRMGLSLPSEAQWEYAARGGTSTAYWTDQEGAGLVRVANLADAYYRSHGGPPGVACAPWDDGQVIHAPVGCFLPNPFGLFDVLGNVAEWCRDEMDEGFYERSPAVDPVNAPPKARLRIRRGGGFSYPTTSARSANRGSTTPSSRDSALGLRPARAVE